MQRIGLFDAVFGKMIRMRMDGCLVTPRRHTEIMQSSVLNTSYFFLCLFVSEFFGPANIEVMSSRSVNSGTVPGQT